MEMYNRINYLFDRYLAKEISSLEFDPLQVPVPEHKTIFVKLIAEQAEGLRALALMALVTSSR